MTKRKQRVPIVTFASTKWTQFCWLFLFLFAAPSLSAQVEIILGDSFPTAPTTDTWFLSKPREVLFHYEGSGWEVHSLDVKHAYVCGGNLVVELHEGNNIDDLMAFSEGSFYGIESVTHCFDSLAVFQMYRSTVFMGHDAKPLLRLERNTCPYTITLITLRGTTGFCIPLVPKDIGYLDCRELHTWGVLGSNGSWLIPPQFDTGFTFVDGIADVIYYGQRRRINEKGEWVE